MDDYSTLDRSRTDNDLVYQMASGQFAALSGKVFEYRDMEQGDDKVCIRKSAFDTILILVGFFTRSPSRLPTQMPRHGREGSAIRTGPGNTASNGEDA